MIEVQGLSKSFGAVTAVDHISFAVQKGEILGFLGPNGAGKTTTMRMLAGYLPATNGTARIGGFDVFRDSMEVRRRIGYLPENPPLYPDMSVETYLDFVARIKNVPPEKRAARINAALEMAVITDKRHELIKRLSRGYRQRVGLAQAIVHDPDVVILDEPTVGLDPKQIIEVRHLIKSLAGSHTIILSTHILPEVSMTCDSVVIINQGRIAAADTLENLAHRSDGEARIRLEVQAAEKPLRELLEKIPGVRRVQIETAGGENRLRATIEAADSRDLASAISGQVAARGWPLHEIRSIRPSLEDIFLQLIAVDPAPGA